ncbi:MAG: CehA/McbA family metallohydrolase, partial [Chitinophagaceae bacterium]|nr:CehA/McbA family metallohydrolase [Chitinophagaceae bacterium]
MRFISVLTIASALFISTYSFAQDHQHGSDSHLVTITNPQPLMAQAIRLKEALSYLGSPLSPADEKALETLQKQPLTVETANKIQEILDPYCIAFVDINPESRVKVEKGPAKAQLIQNGWTSFLVKVKNDAGGTAELKVESPNALPRTHVNSYASRVLKEHIITKGEVENRFLEAHMYTGKPLQKNLTGFKLEYAVVQLYTSDRDQRQVKLGFNVGQGTQDVGFRNTTHILFDIKPSVKVKLRVKDVDGTPAMAAFTITDSIQRMSGKLAAMYPLPSRRVADFDEYPDFFFQKHIYRNDGEHVMLAPGKYLFIYTRGPEYIPQKKIIEIPTGVDSVTFSFELKRWINMAKLGWFSGDHHVHAAGCSHYDSPAEGVKPSAMWRQALGEDLNISALLTWGPSWYHQKNYFTGKIDSLSDKKHLMRYDVEVSGFPSSHAGHIVLLGLKEDDYPGTTKIEDWPTWTGPVLKWAKSQGGATGYAHSGFGLEPVTPTTELPNYILPKMDGIGANEYVVTVTQGLVDFYSVGNT